MSNANAQQIDNLVSLLDGYATNGGHHLNVNVLNRDTLLDAQKHPENYRQLVVRIWGWSAYFVELDKEYPEYKFMQHKGYPTALHYEMIRTHGISPVHRKTFLIRLFTADSPKARGPGA